MEGQLTSSLDLFRRLPSQNIKENLNLITPLLSEEVADELLSSVDAPLVIQIDSSGKKYLVCDYNRDGDSFRSPWTNEYTPSLSDGTEPSPKIRGLEIAMNEAFDVYRELYYEGGVSSVYLWDLEDGFAGVVLLKKSNDSNGTDSSWDSVHVFETLERGRTAQYKLTSTVMLYMVKSVVSTDNSTMKGEVSIGGSMTRQNDSDINYDASTTASNMTSHITNIGKLIEDMEIKMRNSLQEVYFSKTKEVVNTLRSDNGYGEENKRNMLQGELVGLLRGKAAAQV